MQVLFCTRMALFCSLQSLSVLGWFVVFAGGVGAEEKQGDAAFTPSA
jgi:hypothetical protein